MAGRRSTIEAGIGPRVVARHAVHQHPHTGELVVHERARTFADMALRARDAGMRRVLPRHELRMHGRVAHLAAEAGRLHPMQRPVARQQNDDDVDRRQRSNEESGPAHLLRAEIHHGPVRWGRRMLAEGFSLQPCARGDEEEPDDEDRRQCDEDHQSGVGVPEEAHQRRQEHRQEAHAGRCGDDDSRQRQRVPDESTAQSARRTLLQASMYATSASRSAAGSLL